MSDNIAPFAVCFGLFTGDISAIQEVEKNFGIQVLSIISLSHLVDYLKQGSDQALIERIEAYRRQYGV
jgi:orotate phosphoribosyltransferase